MKKWIALLLAALMVFSLAACASETKTQDDTQSQTEDTSAETDAEAETDADAETDAEAETETDADSDLAYVQGKGTLIVGITDFAPMDYQENGEWIGFDADMAKAFAESLGVTAEFVEINWDTKIMELDSKNLDCV